VLITAACLVYLLMRNSYSNSWTIIILLLLVLLVIFRRLSGEIIIPLFLAIFPLLSLIILSTIHLLKPFQKRPNLVLHIAIAATSLQLTFLFGYLLEEHLSIRHSVSCFVLFVSSLKVTYETWSIRSHRRKWYVALNNLAFR
jgi:hypothetical protein